MIKRNKQVGLTVKVSNEEGREENKNCRPITIKVVLFLCIVFHDGRPYQQNIKIIVGK